MIQEIKLTNFNMAGIKLGGCNGYGLFLLLLVVKPASAVLTCKYTAKGQEYNGVKPTTWNGVTCQRWDTQSPHRNSYQNIDTFPDATLDEASNYCRNPDESSTEPWCYTAVSSPTWDYCKIPYCECKTSQRGRTYGGKTSTTSSGKTCQRWDQQTPHGHSRNDPKNFPESKIGDAANYCRNPDNEQGGPWCYTTDSGTRWQYCNIPHCDCKATKQGKQYAGTKTTTISGKTCQRWDSQTPHEHTRLNATMFPDRTLAEASNNCRNPDGEPEPWCYTTDTNIRWELCGIEPCYFYKPPRTTPTPPPGEHGYGTNCKYEASGRQFRGTIDRTRSGLSCQRWDSQEPHEHEGSTIDPEHFPDATLREAANHCRNPTNSDGPWCYTNDPDIRWDFCDVPMCDCRDTQKGTQYIGNISKTEFAIPCQAWSSQFPHSHSDTDPDDFPDATLELAGNKCRNPRGKRDKPWCYTTDANIIWEYCKVPPCDCKMTERGIEYFGQRNNTIHKVPCQRWDQQYPHKHSQKPTYMPEKNLTVANNYCRNPDRDNGGPWCLTMDSRTQWDYCDINYCRSAVPPPTNPPSTTPAYTGQKECKNTRQGTEYNGIRRRTVSGRTCQRWDSQTPHHHQEFTADDFPDATVRAASNYCRNPDFSPLGPWCFTTQRSKRVEYCNVPTCECKQTVEGTEFDGMVAVTQSGKTCQRWDSNTPHSHPAFHPEDFPDKSLEKAKNYCRNPTSQKEPFGPWCFTTDPLTAWEYCDIVICECKTSQQGREYVGKMSRTRTGRKCQRWDSQSPQSHSDNNPRDFPDKSLSEASNYCRNPTGNQGGPWCYTLDPAVRMELCDIPGCRGMTFPSWQPPPPTPSPKPPVPQRQTGSNPGETAGIAIGAILVICFIVTGSGILYWKFRQLQ